MAKRNIGETIGGLASDKIKERTECIQAIRSHFSTDWNSASRIEPKVLRKLLDGVFGSVEKERLLLVKARSKTTKGGSSETTVSKRLVEAGKAVRVVVEKTMGQMVRREVVPTLNRLFRVAEFERDLFPHVGLDYLKALKHIAGYRPHLDHFQDDDWVKSVQI
jgi:alpha-L-fucosidase